MRVCPSGLGPLQYEVFLSGPEPLWYEVFPFGLEPLQYEVFLSGPELLQYFSPQGSVSQPFPEAKDILLLQQRELL